MPCFARQKVSRKMCREACPADGCETVPAMLGSWSDRPRIGTASSGFIFTLCTFKIWRKSRMKTSCSHLSLSDFEGSLPRKLRFHIFHFHSLRKVSHDSFVLTSSTVTFWGKPRTTVSFSHLPLSLSDGSLPRQLRFYFFHFQILKKVSHESFVFTSSTFTLWGKSRTKCVFET